MTDDELFTLMKLNTERTQQEKDKILEEFYKIDDFIKDGLKANAQHYIMDNVKDLRKAMDNNLNPYHTFEVKK